MEEEEEEYYEEEPAQEQPEEVPEDVPRGVPEHVPEEVVEPCPIVYYVDELKLATLIPGKSCNSREIFLRQFQIQDKPGDEGHSQEDLQEWLEGMNAHHFFKKDVNRKSTGVGYLQLPDFETADGLLGEWPEDQPEKASWSLSEQLRQGESGPLRRDALPDLRNELKSLEGRLLLKIVLRGLGEPSLAPEAMAAFQGWERIEELHSSEGPLHVVLDSEHCLSDTELKEELEKAVALALSAEAIAANTGASSSGSPGPSQPPPEEKVPPPPEAPPPQRAASPSAPAASSPEPTSLSPERPPDASAASQRAAARVPVAPKTATRRPDAAPRQPKAGAGAPTAPQTPEPRVPPPPPPQRSAPSGNKAKPQVPIRVPAPVRPPATRTAPPPPPTPDPPSPEQPPEEPMEAPTTSAPSPRQVEPAAEPEPSQSSAPPAAAAEAPPELPEVAPPPATAEEVPAAAPMEVQETRPEPEMEPVPCLLVKGIAASWTEREVKMVFVVLGGAAQVTLGEDEGVRWAKVQLKIPEKLEQAVAHFKRDPQVGDGEFVETCSVTCELLGLHPERRIFVDELDLGSRPALEPSETDREVFIENLPLGPEGCSQDDLCEWLAAYGTVEHRLFVREKGGLGEFSGQGYVRFSTHKEAKECLESATKSSEMPGHWSESERAEKRAGSVYGYDINEAFNSNVLDAVRAKTGAQSLKLCSAATLEVDGKAEHQHMHFVTECSLAQLELLREQLAKVLASFHVDSRQRMSAGSHAEPAREAAPPAATPAPASPSAAQPNSEEAKEAAGAEPNQEAPPTGATKSQSRSPSRQGSSPPGKWGANVPWTPPPQRGPPPEGWQQYPWWYPPPPGYLAPPGYPPHIYGPGAWPPHAPPPWAKGGYPPAGHPPYPAYPPGWGPYAPPPSDASKSGPAKSSGKDKASAEPGASSQSASSTAAGPAEGPAAEPAPDSAAPAAPEAKQPASERPGVKPKGTATAVRTPKASARLSVKEEVLLKADAPEEPAEMAKEVGEEQDPGLAAAQAEIDARIRQGEAKIRKASELREEGLRVGNLLKLKQASAIYKKTINSLMLHQDDLPEEFKRTFLEQAMNELASLAQAIEAMEKSAPEGSPESTPKSTKHKEKKEKKKHEKSSKGSKPGSFGSQAQSSQPVWPEGEFKGEVSVAVHGAPGEVRSMLDDGAAELKEGYALERKGDPIEAYFKYMKGLDKLLKGMAVMVMDPELKQEPSFLRLSSQVQDLVFKCGSMQKEHKIPTGSMAGGSKADGSPPASQAERKRRRDKTDPSRSRSRDREAKRSKPQDPSAAKAHKHRKEDREDSRRKKDSKRKSADSDASPRGQDVDRSNRERNRSEEPPPPPPPPPTYASPPLSEEARNPGTRPKRPPPPPPSGLPFSTPAPPPPKEPSPAAEPNSLLRPKAHSSVLVSKTKPQAPPPTL